MSLFSIWKRLSGRAATPPATGAPALLNPELRVEIRRSFNEAARDEDHFPATIDPRILHVQILLKFFGPLADKKVLDVGCGKGRFARVLREQNPGAKISALDISEDMLAWVPPDIHRVAGMMTELPFAASTFDCAYATESLEHAVEIDRAVAEMCRVLKPGGRLVIIDKNVEHWGGSAGTKIWGGREWSSLNVPAWERWFGRRELEKLLERDCGSVHSEFLSYWEDVAPDGRFLAWFARK